MREYKQIVCITSTEKQTICLYFYLSTKNPENPGVFRVKFL
ncbi:hypothetical protein MICA_583 [Micavibrio aeruginosavorus ARL-13]|uniref:Uncharacterized protein n=1 Tax=Micavibrio aeruginosavorus (strain ARL-13) TaxID=856793 RepID=G2KMY8_MICAA|nr:hypothetical protein MICA_583 [Micavibrio aeruginosavorus ARL-13]